MQSGHYSEFVGISPRTASLIEKYRKSPDETKDTIITRIFMLAAQKAADSPAVSTASKGEEHLDLGQGASVSVGEKLYLFLSEKAKNTNKPDGVGEVRRNGIVIDGKLIPPSRNSFIHPAMVEVQEKLGHRNDKGEIISLSAWRQWYVIRKGSLVRLDSLKDTRLARTRRRGGRPVATLEDLDDM